MDPATLKYAKTHEWVHLDGDVATIGISDFAADALSDLVYIELPEPGNIGQGEVFGTIESTKSANDLYAPIAGEIVEVNDTLPDDLDAVSDDPYGKGWMLKIKVEDAGQLDSLLSQADYQSHCESESH